MASVARRWQRADWLAVLAVVLALMAAAPAIATTIEPPPLSYTNLPFPVLNSPVAVGTPIVMLIARCADSRAEQPYIVSRELVRVDDRLRIPLSPTRNMARSGCEEYRAQTATLPDDIDPGIYVYRGVASVQGWFRNYSVSWETEPFEIVAQQGEKP